MTTDVATVQPQCVPHGKMAEKSFSDFEIPEIQGSSLWLRISPDKRPTSVELNASEESLADMQVF